MHVFLQSRDSNIGEPQSVVRVVRIMEKAQKAASYFLPSDRASRLRPSVRYNRALLNLLGIHGTEGIGSDRAAHLSAARGRFAGHAVYARGGQGARGGAVGEEVEAAVWRGAGADDLCAGV